MPIIATPYRSAGDRSSPATKVVPVVPSNADEMVNVARSLYVTVGGTIRFVPEGQSAFVTWTVPDHFIIPVFVRQVLATSTTATGIFALYGD
jgi:hypothetical protein